MATNTEHIYRIYFFAKRELKPINSETSPNPCLKAIASEKTNFVTTKDTKLATNKVNSYKKQYCST